MLLSHQIKYSIKILFKIFKIFLKYKKKKHKNKIKFQKNKIQIKTLKNRYLTQIKISKIIMYQDLK